MKRGGVGRRTSDDDGNVEVVDELLQVQRFVDARDVLGRDGRAPDDEEVDAGGDDGLVELLRALRRQGARDRHARVPDLLQAVAHEFGLDRLGVHLLHPTSRRGLIEGGDLRQQRIGVVVPGPQPLEVEHPQATEHRDVELERIDRPCRRDILGVAGAARRDDGDVVERVRAAGALGASDLHLHGHAPQPTVGL